MNLAPYGCISATEGAWASCPSEGDFKQSASEFAYIWFYSSFSSIIRGEHDILTELPKL